MQTNKHKNVTQSKVSFCSESCAITKDMEKIFSIRVGKNIRKITVDGTVFELKNFSYVKAFFNNTV